MWYKFIFAPIIIIPVGKGGKVLLSETLALLSVWCWLFHMLVEQVCLLWPFEEWAPLYLHYIARCIHCLHQCTGDCSSLRILYTLFLSTFGQCCCQIHYDSSNWSTSALLFVLCMRSLYVWLINMILSTKHTLTQKQYIQKLGNLFQRLVYYMH